MAYLNRFSSRRTAGSAELVYLLIVLVAGVATAWWAGERIGMDLSSLKAVPTIFGFGQTAWPLSGFDSRVTVSVPPASAAETDAARNTAAYCSPGQMPAFAFGMAELKQRLGDTMGSPIECEHASTANGDTVQHTTAGLAAYHERTNTVTFTDGWQHWALTPGGVISWEGTQSEPPPPSG